MDFMWNIVTGAVAGIGYGLFGYWRKPANTFSWASFLSTVLPAAAIGGVAGFYGEDFGVIEVGSIGVAITELVKNVIKAIFRRTTAK